MIRRKEDQKENFENKLELSIPNELLVFVTVETV